MPKTVLFHCKQSTLCAPAKYSFFSFPACETVPLLCKILCLFWFPNAESSSMGNETSRRQF